MNARSQWFRKCQQLVNTAVPKNADRLYGEFLEKHHPSCSEIAVLACVLWQVRALLSGFGVTAVRDHSCIDDWCACFVHADNPSARPPHALGRDACGVVR
jgi:hypothetical protein